MRNVLEWLESTAAVSPDKMAFADPDSTVGFAELAARAQGVGTYLAARQAPCTPVALFLEKSTTAICGMLGATYARCPYSVLDVRQPRERLLGIVGTLEPGIVLTDAAYADAAREAFEGTSLDVVELEGILDTAADADVIAALRASALDVDPLYINFTSGSTGTPKGVAVCHRSVIDFITHFTSLFGFTAHDEIGNQAPFDFDVSVKDIYSGLLTGATVHMIPRDYFSQPAKLMDYLVERKITTCTWAVSAMCFVSIMGGFDYKVPETVNKVIFSGEVMPVKQLNVWRAHLPHATYVNVYGPTEITCNCTYYVIDREFARDEVIPAGRAFPNEKVFLLDEDDAEVVGAGEHGEVCVSGTALALGYYNDPARTTEAFMQNPLNARTLEMMYRTGDIGMWDEAGNLVYVGRKDHQIKHLGQRIELGEIEAGAQAVDDVERACCIYNAKKKRILLFYTGGIDKDALLEELKSRLPQYMVPSKVFEVESMPMTKNGKIDRKVLAEMGGVR